MGAIETAVGNGAIGALTGGISDIINANNASNAQNATIHAHKDLTLWDKQQQLDLWRKTGYEAQVKQLERAGLNPAMLYAHGGTGGSTSIETGDAQREATKTTIPQSMEIQSQMAMNAKQTELLEAEKNKTIAETAEVQARTPTYGKGMEKTEAEIQQIASQLNINVETVKKLLEEQKNIHADTTKKGAETANIHAETNRIETLTPDESKLLKQQIKHDITINKYLDQMQRRLLDNLIQDVINKKNEIIRSGEKLDIEQFKSEMEADYPSLFNVLGQGVNTVFRALTEDKLHTARQKVQQKH